jgi:ABC-type multidrug transport system fused ATPase/permease subunit
MNTFGDLLKYLKIYRRYVGRRMYVIFVLAGATAVAQGFGITLLLPLIQASQSGATKEGEMGTAEQMLYDLLAWMGIADSMVGILGFIAVVFVGKGLLSFAHKGYKGYLQAQLFRELRERMFDAYAGMDYQHYIRQNTGHFINVINTQTGRFFQSFASFTGFLKGVLTTVGYFAFAFAITWRFSLMALGVGAILLFLFKYLNSYVRNLSRKRSQEMSRLNKLLVQTLQAFKYIVSTGQTPYLRSRVMDSIQQLTGYTLRQRLAWAFTGSIKEPISVLLIVSIIALQVTIFQEPVAPIFVALLLFHRGMQAIISVQSGWQSTMDQIGGVEMVDDELTEVLDHQEAREGKRLDALSDGIEFRDVCFAYNEADGDVLHDINISVPANETVALVGESGAGKSTLIDMMTLMLRPRTGSIEIDGVPHERIDHDSWRSQIGYVSQETVVFDDTVANNIHLWQGNIQENPELREKTYDAARRAHADHFIRDLPNGYQTVVGDRGVRLSGGQRQRLFVARELFKQPNLLLLDEATSALDTASEDHIQSSIDSLHGEVTVVIIAHRLSTIKNVDKVYVLDKGCISEKGSYDMLKRKGDGSLRKMIEMQRL